MLEMDLGDIDLSFYYACKYGESDVVEQLLEDGYDVDVNKIGEDCKTPFYVACEKGYFKIVKLLLNDKRVDINKPNNDGETPLHIICSNGWIEIVKFLLSRREVDLDPKNKYGKTAIETVREIEKEEKSFWESEEQFHKRKRNYREMIKILESYERNPNETRLKLRIQLELAGKTFFLLFFQFFSRNKNIIINNKKNKFQDNDAAFIYSTIVLLSDHYLNFKKN